MRVEFTNDELILMLVSLIRATDPRLLHHGPEGFTVDFEAIERKPEHSPDERLLLRLRGALDTSREDETYGLELSQAERQRLAETLGSLAALKQWPEDVMRMSDDLQVRLLAVPTA